MIPEAYQKLITGRKWYHQGFDGSLMFILPVGQAETRIEWRKPKGTQARVRVCFFSNGRADWYLDMADIQRGVRALIKLAKKDRQISTKLIRAWRQDEKRFERFFWQEFPHLKLRTMTDGELLAVWNRYYAYYLDRFTSSSIIDHFALGTDELIGKMIRKEVGKISRESEFTEIFSIATAPTKQSFISQAEIDLLQIACGKSKVSLKDYQRKYFWINNNYITSRVLDERYFRQEISSWKNSGADLPGKLQQIENTPKLNTLRKRKLFAKYHFSVLLRTLLKISEDFTWWQDERKKSTFFNMHIGYHMLLEVARRTGYKVDELKFAAHSEIAGILSYRDPSRLKLRKRRAYSVIIMTKDGHVIATGRQARQIHDQMLGSVKYYQVMDIRGLSASLGKTIGSVKVVRSATEIGKVQQGDILIAVMTRPDYVPAMKRAAAIVTDEGGITSHAAIVSREMGIPCIIGTKIATQIFKDGDMVEVNANHGWVRKLQT